MSCNRITIIRIYETSPSKWFSSVCSNRGDFLNVLLENPDEGEEIQLRFKSLDLRHLHLPQKYVYVFGVNSV